MLILGRGEIYIWYSLDVNYSFLRIDWSKIRRANSLCAWERESEEKGGERKREGSVSCTTIMVSQVICVIGELYAVLFEVRPRVSVSGIIGLNEPYFSATLCTLMQNIWNCWLNIVKNTWSIESPDQATFRFPLTVVSIPHRRSVARGFIVESIVENRY